MNSQGVIFHSHSCHSSNSMAVVVMNQIIAQCACEREIAKLRGQKRAHMKPFRLLSLFC
jgi:hypothetical protein